MTSTLIIDAVLCLGVLVMVVSPLVWAIRTSHRDRPRTVVDGGRAVAARSRRSHRPAPGFHAPYSSEAWPTS